MTEQRDFPIATDKAGNAFELRPWRCPTCGPAPKKHLGMRGGGSQRYGAGIESPVFQCSNCRLLFPDPFPIPLNPAELYGDPAKYFAQKNEAHKVEVYRARVREICRRAQTPSPRLLDVGSGRGEFLRAAQLEGLSDALGLEFSQAMIDAARQKYGIKMLPQPLEEFAASNPAPFDAIVLNAVLEHVYDPDSLIAASAELLRPHGVLFIDVPNEPHLLTAVGNAWNFARGSKAIYNLAPTWSPYHVYGFNPKAIRTLLAKHGFAVTSMRIRAGINVPHDGTLRDRAKALVAKQVKRVANWTRTASNMSVWAERT